MGGGHCGSSFDRHSDMLKRLELVGFKSFADVSRFEFAPGITAIVGPNGSGKSNIVDAVRWVLGEQSARTLRGGEMADVIFNGSATRKSLGMAEATLTFDNRRRLLPLEADEVTVTRRVYRDGTGEYLINGQESRLREIKELVLGSGAGSSGYTIIAQGKVDELLAASAIDRRAIFEEAAGISRFKAKKQETLRKLATVEQNVQRSKDRLATLENQLRSLRSQAAKAQRYKDYTTQMRSLRLQLGQNDYQELSGGIETESSALATMKAALAETTGEAQRLEAEIRHAHEQDRLSEDKLRGLQEQLAEVHQFITAQESSVRHSGLSVEEQAVEVLRLGAQRAELGGRILALASSQGLAVEEQKEREACWRNAVAAAEAAAEAQQALAMQLEELERQQESDREEQFATVSRAAALHSQAEAQKTQIERIRHELTRKQGELDQIISRRLAAEQAVQAISQVGADVQGRLQAAQEQARRLADQRDSLQRQVEQLHAQLAHLHLQRSDIRARIEILDALDRQLDGLDLGVREVLMKLSDDSRLDDASGLIHHVYGLVADLFTAPHEIAGLIDLALGPKAQWFVIRDAESVDAVVSALGPLSGRVGLIPYQPPVGRDPPLGGGDERLRAPDASPARPVASAERAFPPTAADYVRCDHPELADLPGQLLGDVILVQDLATARQCHRWACSQGQRLRFLTRHGALLEPDGAITLGPLTTGSGLLSRKSELRELRLRLPDLERAIEGSEQELAHCQQQMQAVQSQGQALEAQITALAGEAGDLQQQTARLQETVQQLMESQSLLEHECRWLADDLQRGESLWQQLSDSARQADAEAQEIKLRLDQCLAAIHATQAELAESQQASTEAQLAVERAAAERDRATEQLRWLDEELHKCRREEKELASAIGTASQRRTLAELAVLQATAMLAEAFAKKETLQSHLAEAETERARNRQKGDFLAEQLKALRVGWQQQQSAVHAKELAVQDLISRREALVQRLKEDFGIEWSEFASAPPPEAAPFDAQAARLELDELKRKLSRLGSVNMEALDELNRLEGEVSELHRQHADLMDAQKSLQEIISQINTDSRKLFLETLSSVRGYFQEMFRRLFGGGQADIVLENESDVLESGVDIQARPPGKELRSISLLSGGEKTLTAIALLLAFFRSKPSPFCLLDEVDAALDEANTQRLATLLQDFRHQAQFIVITHKKRTMAVADVLHGVTMQESGVSKIVSVRFEDWPDDESAPARQAA